MSFLMYLMSVYDEENTTETLKITGAKNLCKMLKFFFCGCEKVEIFEKNSN